MNSYIFWIYAVFFAFCYCRDQPEFDQTNERAFMRCRERQDKSEKLLIWDLFGAAPRQNIWIIPARQKLGFGFQRYVKAFVKALLCITWHCCASPGRPSQIPNRENDFVTGKKIITSVENCIHKHSFTFLFVTLPGANWTRKTYFSNFLDPYGDHVCSHVNNRSLLERLVLKKSYPTH